VRWQVSSESSRNAVFKFATKARTTVEKDIEIHLYGLAEGVTDEPFTHSLLFAEKERAMLERNVEITALDDVIVDAVTPLRFRVRFNPMKVRESPVESTLGERVCGWREPTLTHRGHTAAGLHRKTPNLLTFRSPGSSLLTPRGTAFQVLRTKVDFVINKRSGGRWRFELHLEATEPDLDGTLQFEALVGYFHTEYVEIANASPNGPPMPFQAYFSAESPMVFTVSPEEGVLVGDTPTTLAVTYAPSEFGKEKTVGRLVACTEDMQWTFDLEGRMPKYVPPSGRATIQNEQRLAPQTLQSMQAAHLKSARTNHMRDYLKKDLSGTGR
jgi:hypothetical protein